MKTPFPYPRLLGFSAQVTQWFRWSAFPARSSFGTTR